MKWNAWLLPLLLGSALGAVYVLPKAGETAASAVNMKLPDTSDGWEFENHQATQKEIQVLGTDTDFSKAFCRRARPGEWSADGRLVPDHIDLSIVLSGYDLNSSIHRPERCMPTQGHNITASASVAFNMESGHAFKAKRLHSVKSVPGRDNEKVRKFNCVTYYFFVGRNQITNDHLERTLIDMKDRLVHGMDQRWAYVSVSMMYGKLPWIEKEVTEAEADEKLRKFVREFAERQIDWKRIER